MLKTTLPADYIGPCIYSTVPTGFYRASSTAINVVYGSVSILEPANQASISAGVNLRIRLSSNIMNVNASVQLDCGIPDVAPITVNILSYVPNLQGINVPTRFYGTECTLRIISLPEKFIARNSLDLVITQPVTITRPTSTQTFLTNSNVPVLLASPVNVDALFTLVQNCSNTIRTFSDLSLGTVFDAPLPSDYSGLCTFFTYALDFYRASLPVTVMIVSSPVVAFVQPLNQSFLSAGSRFGIVLSSTESPANFTVQLDCMIPNVSPATAIIASNAVVVPQFTVPGKFYRSCIFSILDPVSPFIAINTVNVTVTQPVGFTQPLNQAIFNVNDPVPVVLFSPVITSNTVTLMQNCNGTIRSYPDVNINATLTATLPTDYIGSCLLWTTAKGMYRASSAISISAVATPQVRIVSPTNMTYVSAGTPLGVRLLSSSISTVFNVQLDCGISGVTPVVANITSNLAANTALNVPSKFYGMNCSLSVINSNDFIPVNSVTVVVTQATAFTLPVRSGSYLVNDLVPMLLISPVNTGTSFNVTQNCNGSLTTFSNVLLNVTVQTPLPSNYLGGCSYTSQAVGFYRASSVAINVVQGTVSFAAPLNGSSIKAGTNTTVRLNSNIKSSNFTVQLDCFMNATLPATSTVLSNVNVNFPVPSNFRGNNCTFSVINPPSSFKPQNTVSVKIVA